MNRRGEERRKQRLTCELVIDGRPHAGIVLDVSRRGLFVQTGATPAPGDRLRLRLPAPDGGWDELEARVVRKRVVPRRLAAVASGGVGLRLNGDDEVWRRILAGERRVGRVRPASRPERPSTRSFRIRVKQSAGPRSRVVSISAADEQQATARALEQLGAGWTVLEVDAA